MKFSISFLILFSSLVYAKASDSSRSLRGTIFVCNVACRSGHHCESGTCVKDPLPAFIPIGCESIRCEDGYHCNDGKCYVDPVIIIDPIQEVDAPTLPFYHNCSGVVCFSGYHCENGECVKDATGTRTPSGGCLVSGDMMFPPGMSTGKIVGLTCNGTYAFKGIETICGTDGSLMEVGNTFQCPAESPYCVQCGAEAICVSKIDTYVCAAEVKLPQSSSNCLKGYHFKRGKGCLLNKGCSKKNPCRDNYTCKKNKCVEKKDHFCDYVNCGINPAFKCVNGKCVDESN